MGVLIDANPPLPYIKAPKLRSIFSAERCKLLSVDGEIRLDLGSKGSSPFYWAPGTRVTDNFVPDGSWPIETAVHDGGISELFWLYPYSARVHVWTCRDGLRTGARDLTPEQAEAFLSDRADSPTILAKRALAGKTLSGEQRKVIQSDCGIESIYVSFLLSETEPDVRLALGHVSVRVAILLAALDWDSMDFRNRALRNRLVPILTRLVEYDQRFPGIIERRLVAWSHISSLALRIDPYEEEMFRPARRYCLKEAREWTFRPETENSVAYPLERTIKGRFIPKSGTVPAIELYDFGLIRQSRMLWSYLYLYELIDRFVLSEPNTSANQEYRVADDIEYEVIAQVGDFAIEGRSISFGAKNSFTEVKLIPDMYFYYSRGYKSFKAEVAAKHVPWSQRKAIAFWRGSTTGWFSESGSNQASVREALYRSPRVSLARRSLISPGLIDAKLTDLVGVFASDEEKEFLFNSLVEDDLMGNKVAQIDFINYKFQIDVDGNSNSWGFFNKLLLGSCTLKVQSEWRQWYYDDMTPWVHFVPVANDLSDLIEKLEWCLSNDDQAQRIGESGRKFAESLTFEKEMSLAAARALSVCRPTR